MKVKIMFVSGDVLTFYNVEMSFDTLAREIDKQQVFIIGGIAINGRLVQCAEEITTKE